MQERQTCAECGRHSPLTETGYTLISKEFGWRLLRRKALDGSLVLEWRCPTCWAKYKQRNAIAGGPPSSRDAQSLSTSGEQSRWLLDQEAAPPSSRVRPVEDPEPGADRGLPRKRA